VNRYSVSGRTAATAATANHCGAQLWNASSSRSLWVVEIHWVQTAAVVSNLGVVRTSARGATPASTVTPDADNDFDGTAAPASGALLDLGAFGTQPTLGSPVPFRWNLPAAIGSGLMWVFPTPFRVLAGTGLAIHTPVAVILQPADVTFVWEE
jgi:hypothetical protein